MFSSEYMNEVIRIAKSVDYEMIEMIVDDLQTLRDRDAGRLFILKQITKGFLLILESWLGWSNISLSLTLTATIMIGRSYL